MAHGKPVEDSMNSYEQLFNDYLVEMRAAQATAQAWWEALRAGEKEPGSSAAKIEELLEARWPLGAVSHPAVIAAFRKSALRCQALNDAAEEDDEEGDDEDDDDGGDDEDWGDDEDDDDLVDLAALEAPVEPRELLIEMLPGRADDLAEFLADFVFTPLGLDKDDRWI
jgi:hypothetical protein